MLIKKFPLGQCVITTNAQEHLTDADVFEALARHQAGDWGDLDEADVEENEFSLTRYLRLLSAYHAKDGTKFWVITEADRSVTTVLLPEDY